MKKLKPWLVVLLVFVAGFVGGVVATRATVRHFVRQALSRPDTVREFMEQRMVRRLHLDPDQRRKVHQILVDRQGDLRALRGEFEPRFLDIVTNADASIAAVLTPEQKEQFDKLRDDARQFWPRKSDGSVRRRE